MVDNNDLRLKAKLDSLKTDNKHDFQMKNGIIDNSIYNAALAIFKLEQEGYKIKIGELSTYERDHQLDLIQHHYGFRPSAMFIDA